MSIKVREWLRALGLYDQTTHEDRLAIDKEVESRTGVDCDYAIERKMIDKEEFKRIVMLILRRRKQTREKILDKMAKEKVIV